MKKCLLIFLSLLSLPAFAAPTITVQGSAVTLLGTTQTISITATLLDPGQTGMLRVSGTGIVPIMKASTVTPGTTATVGPIFANDVIVDGFGNVNSTFYRVSVFVVNNNGILASTPALENFYAFQGSGTIDLVSATPLAPSFMNGTGGAVSVPGNFSVVGTSTFASPISAARYNGIVPSKQIFTSNGTFTIPAGVTAVKVTIIGGGGGGGGAGLTNGGSGGGSGSIEIKWLASLTPGNTISVQVGTGGAGGNPNAGAGGQSSISSGTQTITSVIAAGGSAGVGNSAPPQAGGNGGGTSGSPGDIQAIGNQGSPLLNNAIGGSGAPGPQGGGGWGGIGGAGGSGFVGSGGGGAPGGTGSTQQGGGGGAGMVIFEWVS